MGGLLDLDSLPAERTDGAQEPCGLFVAVTACHAGSANWRSAMPTVDVVYALVPDDELEGLRQVLRRRLTASEISTRHPSPGDYALCDERLRDDLSAARHGARFAAIAGAALGLVAAWILGGETSSLSLFLLFAGGGAALGGLIGGVTGMQRHEVLDDDPAGTIALDGDAAVHLLEIRSERHAYWAHRILAAHRNVCLLESPVAEAAQRSDRAIPS
jgi:hypothetical protein